jgi:hypothetical protein
MIDVGVLGLIVLSLLAILFKRRSSLHTAFSKIWSQLASVYIAQRRHKWDLGRQWSNKEAMFSQLRHKGQFFNCSFSELPAYF